MLFLDGIGIYIGIWQQASTFEVIIQKKPQDV